MLESLGKTLKKITDKVANALFLDKSLLESIIKDLQRALIEADVNVLLVKKISDEIKQVAQDERIKGIDKKEHIIKLLYDRLLEILGKEKKELILKSKHSKIMLLGLYGAGKTTTTAKLANYYNKRGIKTCILGLDVHRPAASEQLEQLGKTNNIQVFIKKGEKNPQKIYKEYEKQLKEYNLVLIDTAGRHSLDKELITEIKALNKLISPDNVLLVMPADIGQAAKAQASQFQEALSISGVIITRMDSTAKAGGSLTACYETKAPVYFITTGEKVNDLELFDPKAFSSRLLGMGDLSALIEKIKSATGENKEAEERLKQGKFTIEDFYEQIKNMQNVGTFDKLMDLIPGFGNIKEKISPEALQNQQDNLKKWKSAIDSMTKEEKENPEILEKASSRIQRIAKGSGTTTSSIRQLLSQYNLIKDMSKQNLENLDIEKLQKGQLPMSPNKLRKLAKKFKGFKI